MTTSWMEKAAKLLEDNRMLVIRGGRRCGKTTFGINEAKKTVGGGNAVLWSTATWHLMRQCLEDYWGEYVYHEIHEVPNTVRIGPRFKQIGLVVIDEAAFCDQDYFRGLITEYPNSKILIMSNTNGDKDSDFYHLSRLLPEIVVTSYENPFNSHQILEEIRADSDDKEFRQEFLAEWVDWFLAEWVDRGDEG